MKWVLIVILIFVIMLIARSITEQYSDKFDFYNNLKLFLNQFKINLGFRQEKLEEFLNKIECKKQFKLFIEDYKSYLKTNEINFDNIKLLDEAEKKELSDIVKNIGKYNAKSEISQLDGFLAQIDEKLTKAKEDKQRLCPVILKLSLLFAIGLAILLV